MADRGLPCKWVVIKIVGKWIAVVEWLLDLAVVQARLGLLDSYLFYGRTTAHAVINLNRTDRGARKYILIEQGEYFETVIKPRIQKATFSSEWSEGKPTTSETGVSHAFKVIKLESYEDTLNNLELTRTLAQQSLLDSMPAGAKEDYLLRYMLDIESRGSLLSVDQFKKPFDCKLKVSVDSAGAYEERPQADLECIHLVRDSIWRLAECNL